MEELARKLLIIFADGESGNRGSLVKNGNCHVEPTGANRDYL
jgi:hypothetical protein